MGRRVLGVLQADLGLVGMGTAMRISCGLATAARLLPFVAMAIVPNLARAAVTLANVAPARGLNFTVTYGATFGFAGDSPNVATTKRIMQRNMGNGAAVGDFDNDGDDDVYLLGQGGTANRLYRNDLVNGQRHFTNVAAIAGVGDIGFGRVAHFVDLDNDGWSDLLLINDDMAGASYAPSKVFRNNADGTFADVTVTSGFAPVGLIKGGACLGDYDGDGRLDVYVGLWLMEVGSGVPSFSGHNHLFHNLGNFQFEDVTLTAGVGIIQRDTYSCAFADFDNDADQDLYVAIDHTSDAYFRNDAGVFTDQTLAVGATHTGNDMGLAVSDFDNDGDLDIYSTNITDVGGIFGTTLYNTLLVNQLSKTGSLTFEDEAGLRGVGDTHWGWGTEFVDVDNDADLDIYAVDGFDEWITLLRGPAYALVDTPEALFLNHGAGKFARSSGTGADLVRDARALVAFDYNRDGRQDFLITNINELTVLLENQTDPAGHWLTVKAIGECGFNANAVGTRMYVTVGETIYMREVTVGGSYLAGRSLEQHFGLGDAVMVDSLRVVFPDGTELSRGAMPADRRYAVLHETKGASAQLVVSRDLQDVARFQRCMGAVLENGAESGCGELDGAGDGNGQVDLDDLPAFIGASEWKLPGCVGP